MKMIFHLTVVAQDWAPIAGVAMGCSMTLWVQHDLVKGWQPGPFNGAVSYDTCPANPQLVLELSLLFGSFSLCLHSGRLIGSGFNFPELSSLAYLDQLSSLSVHSSDMASDPSGKHHEELSFPLLAIDWPFMLHAKCIQNLVPIITKSVTKILCLWNEVHLLSPF